MGLGIARPSHQIDKTEAPSIWKGLLSCLEMAERAGFEPARVLPLHVFKTCPFNRSGISP
jgi:hypothetical protein